MVHQTQRMLFMANSHVSDNPFHAECLKLLRKLQDAPEKRLSHSILLKRMKIDAKTFQEIITTLEQQGDVLTAICSTAGRPQRHYQLLGETSR
jgi:predicted ArsR family transcriptional regulator